MADELLGPQEQPQGSTTMDTSITRLPLSRREKEIVACILNVNSKMGLTRRVLFPDTPLELWASDVDGALGPVAPGKGAPEERATLAAIETLRVPGVLGVIGIVGVIEEIDRIIGEEIPAGAIHLRFAEERSELESHFFQRRMSDSEKLFHVTHPAGSRMNTDFRDSSNTHRVRRGVSLGGQALPFGLNDERLVVNRHLGDEITSGGAHEPAIGRLFFPVASLAKDVVLGAGETDRQQRPEFPVESFIHILIRYVFDWEACHIGNYGIPSGAVDTSTIRKRRDHCWCVLCHSHS